MVHSCAPSETAFTPSACYEEAGDELPSVKPGLFYRFVKRTFDIAASLFGLIILSPLLLVVAILIGRFGHKLKLVTYTTMSANLMLREIGIVLFLASVGIEAGADFVQTVVEGNGLLYVGYGFLITVIPLLLVGIVARWYYKVNYFTLMGLIAGSTTDPPALAYANQVSGNDAPSVGYSTVYPLTMFLRIIAGQMLLLALM